MGIIIGIGIIVLLIIIVIALYNGLINARQKVENAWSQIDVQLQRRFDLIPNFVETVKGYMAVSENYPDLKANQSFSDLQEELRNTENKISFSRQFYNDSVTIYNTKLEVIPTNIIASMFKFKPKELFEVENEEVRKNIKVSFDK